jgi:hypothetical protein
MTDKEVGEIWDELNQPGLMSPRNADKVIRSLLAKLIEERRYWYHADEDHPALWCNCLERAVDSFGIPLEQWRRRP